MSDWDWRHTQVVLAEVKDERERQHEKWGEQNHPIYCDDKYNSPAHFREGNRISSENWKRENDRRVAAGTLSWDGIAMEEVTEAFAEEDPVKLREELVQSAAVFVAMIECLDRQALRELEEELQTA